MFKKEIVKAAAVQISPIIDDVMATTYKVADYIKKAASQGADIVVFPETFIPNYPYFSFIKPPVMQGKDHLRLYNNGVVVPGPVTDLIGEAVKETGTVAVIGVNELDGGSIYNTQLVFDANGEIVHKRRKITPTYHERMVWGQGDGSGLKAVDTAVGKVGALACWEHYNPLARYALMTEGEQIHCAQFPGSMVGQVFADQMEVTIRHHALESGCFVINSTGWLGPDQIESLTSDNQLQKALIGGCMTAIISPEGKHLCDPITEGEGIAIADLDMKLITKRKRMMDSTGHYARPELLSLQIDKSAHQMVYEKNEGASTASPKPVTEKTESVILES
ncbi:Nit6803 family nitrilase [Reichenbachiella versicolor]|uniref:Nit6803 family nitrilase n=1 Tax=Reichenbachiella versicolor TaxID=1821036 RepID=UPI000D6E937A|nr:Nit6803 family nitrilase [Reichenbachiella versicolor]